MSSNLLKNLFFLFLVFLALATGSVISFAQDDDNQQDLEVANQIQDLNAKMQAESKKLDELQKMIDQSGTESTSSEVVVTSNTETSEAVVQPASTQPIPVQSDTEQVAVPPSAPVVAAQPAETTSVQPDAQPVATTAAQPVGAAGPVGTTSAQTVAPVQPPSYEAPPTPLPTTIPLSVLHSSAIVKVSGELRAAMGINSDGGLIFTDANEDLDQKNWRIISNAGPNNNINTYDPAIYSMAKVILDVSAPDSVVSAHLNITVDPWSFRGATESQLVTTEWGDKIPVQYFTTGGTNYTYGNIISGLNLGGSVAMPEIKVNGNIVPAISIPTSIVNNQYHITDILNAPAQKIDYTFMPLREAWVDVTPTDDFKLRIFPLATESQALTTDDPLELSNHTEWWAESPWIDGWQQGNLNSGDTPLPSFTQGYWDKSVASLAQDDSGNHLTALRGVALSWKPDETSIQATIASPLTPWQDYSDINTVPGSVRIKQFVDDMFYIGAVGNMHEGYTMDEDLDATNYVGAMDSGFMPVKGLKINAEYATSTSKYDITSPDYETKYDGNAYYASIEVASNPDDEDMLRTDYFGMHPIDKTEDTIKSIVYFARMDEGFESTLSDYNGTRGDSFWADSLTFYPSEYRYLPGVTPSTSQYDLEPFGIGDGIDYGRSVVSWRADTNSLEGKLQGLMDIRHVTDDNGDNIENVYRASATYEPTDKLTTKLLLLDDQLPKTVTGVDPFLSVDDVASTPYLNTAVAGGEDPSLKTVSVGARYEINDWAAINGVYKYTNDFNLESGDFPQGDLNSTYFSIANINGRNYAQEVPFLYDQGSFEQAPYPYYNIFKTGLELTPSDQWHVYLDYTRNPNKFAGNIDDNMSHYGIEASYVPTPKIGFFARYTLSQGYDINRLINDGELEDRNYNNFFFETRMILPKDITMSLSYGVGPAYNVATSSTNPYLTYYSTAVLQTQHIIILSFDKKF